MNKCDKLRQNELISAKKIFILVENLGEGLHINNSIHIYEIDDEKCEKSYRCDCGDYGSFEIKKHNGYEEYNMKNHDFIWIEGIIYTYHCLSTNFSGYPVLPKEKVFDLLNMK